MSVWGRTWFRAGITGAVTALVVGTLVGTAGVVMDAAPAAAADDEATSSAVTLTNEHDALEPEGAPFPDLEVTISQTKDLVSQGIRVSWTGATRSTAPVGGNGGTNFLQIAQCWGEDPDNPGHPDRRTCQYGGTLGFGSQRDGFTSTENVTAPDERYTAFGRSAYTAIPFVAFNDGGIVDDEAAPAGFVVTNLTKNSAGVTVQKPDDQAVDVNSNAYFTGYTTNEIPWAPSGDDGSGTVSFEVQTAMQSTGLGCGTPVTVIDGSVTGKSCWLVIIPRGTADSGESSISQSGLWWDAWEHHVATKLEFKPLGVRCEIGKAERQLAGSELIAQAVASWQPKLCAGDDGAPFVLRTGNEADELPKAAGTSPSALTFTSRPMDVDSTALEADPLVYAPVAISGVAVSFAIDREPSSTASDEYKAAARLPFTELKLTPRLLAKLLTASYRDALPSGADKSHIGYVSAAKPGKNPRTIVQDPEFLEINSPEWGSQNIAGASISDVMMPSGRSDLAVRVWEYVLADDEARKWLAGEPDRWGMIVNPWYSTGGETNPSGVPNDLPTESFPKADPIEKPDETSSGGSAAVNLVTWRPFTGGLDDGAHQVLRGDGMVLGAWDAANAKFTKSARQLLGNRKVMALASAPAAERYQTVTASLKNPAGQFVAPSRDSMAAAAAAMVATENQAVRVFDPAAPASASATTAYPLTVPVYAALNPAQTDPKMRAAYADLIRYAVGPGQAVGTDDGELPPGYAPLPDAWAAQALVAAAAIENGVTAATPPSGTTGITSSGTVAGPGGTTVPSAAAPPGTAPVSVPAVTGQAAGQLAGAATPDDPDSGMLGAAVPIGVMAGILAAIAVPLIPRLRRRV